MFIIRAICILIAFTTPENSEHSAKCSKDPPCSLFTLACNPLFCWQANISHTNNYNVKLFEFKTTSRPPAPEPKKALAPSEQEKHHVLFKNAATFGNTASCSEESSLLNPQTIIYEGMVLDIDQNGNYELKGEVETPATNVTLRLQFRLWEKVELGDDLICYEHKGSVTLPPISFKPTVDQIHAGAPLQWTLKKTGQSPILTKEFLEGVCIERIGVVEVGTIPSR